MQECIEINLTQAVPIKCYVFYKSEKMQLFLSFVAFVVICISFSVQKNTKTYTLTQHTMNVTE